MRHVALAGITIALSCGEAAFAADRCEAPITTREMEQCLASELAIAKSVLATYEDEVRRALAADPSAEAAFSKAQASWSAFVAADCGAVYEYHREGSIRSVAKASCEVAHTVRRTHDLWTTYIRGAVSELKEPAGGCQDSD